MITSTECIPCFVRQAAEAIALSGLDSFQQARILRKVMHDKVRHGRPQDMKELLVFPTAQLTLYGLLVAAASLAGGWILLAVRLTHLRLQIASSFVAGLMLAMALLHFIPHATHQNRSIDQTMRFVLAGFLVMFLLQRFLPHHHHDVSEEAPEHSSASPAAAFCPRCNFMPTTASSFHSPCWLASRSPCSWACYEHTRIS